MSTYTPPEIDRAQRYLDRQPTSPQSLPLDHPARIISDLIDAHHRGGFVEVSRPATFAEALAAANIPAAA